MNPNPITGREMPHLQEIPKPGSKEAVEQGCTCRCFTEGNNDAGSSEMVRTHFTNRGCPLHASERRE